MAVTQVGANAVAGLAAGIPASLFGAMMPPVTDIWVTKPGTVTARMVRDMEIIAGGISLAIGATLSMSTRDPAPFLVTALTLAGLVTVYEYVLRKDLLGEHTSE